MAASVPVHSVVAVSVQAHRQLRSGFPGGSARHSPAGGPSVLPAADSEFHAPNNALQRTEAGVRLFSVYRACFSPASVAELESVRRFAALVLPVGFPLSPPGIRVSGRFPSVSPRSFSFSGRGFPVSQRSFSLSPQGFLVSPPGFLFPGQSFALSGRFSAASEPPFRVPPPNNALQRTAAGGRAFSAIHVLRRQPPSLSLSSLGVQPSSPVTSANHLFDCQPLTFLQCSL